MPSLQSNAIEFVRVGVPDVSVPYSAPPDVLPPVMPRTIQVSSDVNIARPLPLPPTEPVSGVGAGATNLQREDERIYFPRIPLSGTTAPPPPPAMPSLQSNAIEFVRVGVPDVSVPYSAPPDVLPPVMPRTIQVSSEVLPYSPFVAPYTDPVPSFTGTTQNGIFPTITYGGQTPLYLPFGDLAYIQREIDTLSGEVIFINESIATLSGQVQTISSELTNLSAYVYTIQNDPSQWSLYPAVSTLNMSGNTIINSTSIEIDGQFLTADASDLLLNGIPIATITSISNVADWALFPAIGEVNMAGFNISQAGTISLSGGGTILNVSAGGSNVLGINGVDGITMNSTNGAFNLTAPDVNINSTSAVRQMDIQSAGSMLLTSAIALNLACGAESSWNLGGLVLINAGVGVNIFGAGFFSVESATASIACAGIVNIGSLVYTTIEHLTINDSVISRYRTTDDNISICNVNYIGGDNGGASPKGDLTIEGKDVGLRLKTTAGVIITASGTDISGSPQISMTAQSLDERSYPIDHTFNIQSPTWFQFAARNNDPAPETTLPPVTLQLASSKTDASGSMNLTYDGDRTLLLSDVNLIGVEQLAAISANINSAVLTSSGGGTILLLNGVPLVTAETSDISSWSLYPAVSILDMCGFAISNTPTITISGNVSNVVLTASGTQLLVDGLPVYTGDLPPSDVANWALYPAVANVNMSGSNIDNIGRLNLSAGAVALTASGTELLVNGLPVYTGALPPDNASNWATYAAVGNVNMSGFAISNVSGFQLDGAAISTDGFFIFADGNNGVERWSQFPAVFNLNMSGNDILNTDQIDASGVSCVDAYINNLYVYTPDNMSAAVLTSTNSGATLLLNSVPVLTSADISSSVARWADFPAVTNVDVSGFSISNVNVGTFSNIVLNASAIALGSGAGIGQNPLSVAVGAVAGVGMGENSVAIGYAAGQTGQQRDCVAVGAGAGSNSQTQYAIAVGELAGATIQGLGCVAVGYQAGQLNQTQGAVAIGYGAGSNGQKGTAVAIGFNAGQDTQGNSAVAIGLAAGQDLQQETAVAIGYQAGVSGQRVAAIAIGNTAGGYQQGSGCIALGANAGQTGQGQFSVAIGSGAGAYNQAPEAFALGASAGGSNQGLGAFALGTLAGASNQGVGSVAIGSNAGGSNQGGNSIAIGNECGENNQGTHSIAIGNSAINAQGNSAIAIGYQTAIAGQGENSIAMGTGAGYLNQQSNCIAIGFDCGSGGQKTGSIAIGVGAGDSNLGANSIAIGTYATQAGASLSGTIVINATGLPLNPALQNSCYVAPVRSVASSAGFFVTAHNNTTGELIQTLTASLSMDNTISNTQQISYDTGVLTTTIDGILQVNGNAEFTQSVTADTTLNVLGLTTLSSCVIQNISAGATSEVVYWDASSGKLAHAPANAIGLTPANTFVVAENGSDSTGDGSFINPYKTIQFAINQCTDGAQDNGQTIWVMAGLYVENLTIANKNINIRGSGDTQHTYNTTIRGNMTITSSNTNRSYRTISFQNIQIQNYTATTGTAITLSTSGTGKGRLVLTGCYVIGASTGVSLLDATATNCDWVIIADSTRFYTAFAYSAPLINLGGNQGTACSFTLNQSVVEYESPAGSTNSLIKVGNYSGLTTTYSTITQPLNPSLNNSALTNGLVWIANLPNSGVVATSTNGANIGTTLLFSGTQATLGVAGTPALYINQGCPSVYLIGGTLSVRSNSTPATHAIVGSPTGVTKTILYFNTSNMMTTRGSANKADATNITITPLIALT